MCPSVSLSVRRGRKRETEKQSVFSLFGNFNASSHLYKRVCLSVGLSVRPASRPSGEAENDSDFSMKTTREREREVMSIE